MGYVTYTEETRNAYRILAQYLEGTSSCVPWTYGINGYTINFKLNNFRSKT
jgi:hypothetical protein